MSTKRLYLFPVLILAGLISTGCEESALVATGDRTPATANSIHADVLLPELSSLAVENEYIVVLKETMAPGEVDALAREITAAYGGDVLFTYRHALKGFAATLPPSALNAVSTHADVAYIEQSQVVSGNAITMAETQAATPWHLDRIDQRDLPLDDQYNAGFTGDGVTAYIIDSGLDLNHPEFSGRASLGADLVDVNDGGEDCHGHGTHVGGLIGSDTYGVAKDVNLKAVRVLDCTNTGTVALVIAGLDTTVALATGPTVATLEPSVVNLSIVGVVSTALQAAIQNTVHAGLTVVGSAGDVNSDACPFAPSSAVDAISVAATTITDRRTATSNYGACVDLFAPGENITSTWLSGGTATAGGTSQSAALVTGVAALYLEAEPTAPPTLVASSVTDVILAHATFGKVGNIPSGSQTPNLLLFSDVPNNPRSFTITLDDKTIKPNGKGIATFSWAPASISSNMVDLYVDNILTKTVDNDGLATLKFDDPVFTGPFDVKACQEGSTIFCSDVVTVTFFYFKLKLKKLFVNQHDEGIAKLKWNPDLISKGKVDFYVDRDPDGTPDERVENDGFQKLRFDPNGGPYAIRACEKNSTTFCSNEVTADFTGAPFEFEACRECDDDDGAEDDDL